MRELRHLKELQLKANGAHEPPALKQEPMVERLGSERCHVVAPRIEKAPEEGRPAGSEPPGRSKARRAASRSSTASALCTPRPGGLYTWLCGQESLPITIGEVQRSVSIDRARLQEEMRTAQLQQRLRRRSLSPASPSRRPLYALPEPRAERRELPADVAARLSSSPALAAAAQHWGVPRKASTSPRRRPAAKAAAKMAARNQIPVSHGPKGGMQYGMGIARGPVTSSFAWGLHGFSLVLLDIPSFRGSQRLHAVQKHADASGPFSPVRALWRPSFS